MGMEKSEWKISNGDGEEKASFSFIRAVKMFSQVLVSLRNYIGFES